MSQSLGNQSDAHGVLNHYNVTWVNVVWINFCIPKAFFCRNLLSNAWPIMAKWNGDDSWVNNPTSHRMSSLTMSLSIMSTFVKWTYYEIISCYSCYKLFSTLMSSWNCPCKHARICRYSIRIETMLLASFQFWFSTGTFWHVYWGELTILCEMSPWSHE